jgi:hypothetical protein
MDTGPLRKILELEQKKGYTDSAVFGGLDRFLHKWAGQAAASINNRGILRRFRRLFNPGYASLNSEQRREWVSSVLEFLADMEGGNSGEDGLSATRTVPSATKKSSRKAPGPAGCNSGGEKLITARFTCLLTSN